MVPIGPRGREQLPTPNRNDGLLPRKCHVAHTHVCPTAHKCCSTISPACAITRVRVRMHLGVCAQLPRRRSVWPLEGANDARYVCLPRGRGSGRSRALTGTIWTCIDTNSMARAASTAVNSKQPTHFVCSIPNPCASKPRSKVAKCGLGHIQK